MRGLLIVAEPARETPAAAGTNDPAEPARVEIY